MTDNKANSYVYFKTWNIDKHEAIFMVQQNERIWFKHVYFNALAGFPELMDNRDVIYNNGGVMVLGSE